MLPPGPYVSLGQVKQRNGKLVDGWAVAANFDAGAVVSNTFELEWPPRSGLIKSFPEIDRAAWLDLERAAEKILAAQQPFLERALALRAQILGRACE